MTPDAWNAAHPVGTRVLWFDGQRNREAVTVSEARWLPEGIAVVEIRGEASGLFDLDTLGVRTKLAACER